MELLNVKQRVFGAYAAVVFFCLGFTISALSGTLHKAAKTDKNAKRFHLVRNV